MEPWSYLKAPTDSSRRHELECWGLEYALRVWLDADQYVPELAKQYKANAIGLARLRTNQDVDGARGTLEMLEHLLTTDARDYEAELSALVRRAHRGGDYTEAWKSFA